MIQHKSNNLTVFESVLYRTTSGLVTGHEAVILVDPTWLPDEVAYIRHYAEDRLEGNDLHLVFTHSDYDHILGYGAFPGAKTIASKAFTENPEQEQQLRIIREFDEKYYLDRPHPVEYPFIDFVIDKDEEFLVAGEARLTFWLAPGHNPDGMLILIEPEGVLFLGDYLSDIEFPFVYHSFAEYRKTLDKIENLVLSGLVKTLVPGHGNATDNRQEMERRLTESRWYLDQLEKSVKENSPFPEEELWSRYKYPAGQKEYHENNRKLLMKEF